ncbi:MAG: hypothetical protein O7F73_16905, partial [Gammaproteobacteria bacterium]|nr:hypothetical protein [Gammaproteobacteria bacterium]
DYYKVSEEGLFEDGNYSEYWQCPDKIPYLIRYCSELAGFALVHDASTHFVVDQFFVMLKFQGAGVAEAAALDIFDKHRGCWLVESLISNA